MKRIVVFSGAGLSAESGLKTFRDGGGLWEEFDINDVATPEAWMANPALVLKFYNLRRRQILNAQPNSAHLALAALEKTFDVKVITQNIDDLHERAGSTKIIHLHGEIFKVRSSKNPHLIQDHKDDLQLGEIAEDGSQLRPHIVWFGESVPEMDHAIKTISRAEIVIVVGTSLNVYPAAGLIQYAPVNAQFFIIDPSDVNHSSLRKVTFLRTNATVGVPQVVEHLTSDLQLIKPDVNS